LSDIRNSVRQENRMTLPTTEMPHPQSSGLDLKQGEEILAILWRGQAEAIEAVATALPALARGGEAMAGAIRAGGNIVYAAAGSSGMMALADGLEIPPTFGVSSSRIKVLRAGGFERITIPKEGAEDDIEAARRDAGVIGPNDCVICLAASGNTPYPVEIMAIAKARGAVTVGLANNPGTRLLEGADIAVLLPTPPEVIAGSTRLGAGTAQKIALNLMSTLMGIRLGHVLDGLMVNVVASNAKLKWRAEHIVMTVTGCNRTMAADSLARSGGRVKEAALIARGAAELAAATALLRAADQSLRKALAALPAG